MKKSKKRKGKELIKKPRLKRKRKKICIFCKGGVVLDYKNNELMRRFITDRGKIVPPRISGCCAAHQREVARAVKRARQMGVLPYGS